MAPGMMWVIPGGRGRRYPGNMRFLGFSLASLSFAALLGQLYGVWSMQAFAVTVMLPGTILLAGLGYRQPWIRRGALGGIVAAIAYDLFRLPFVLAGAPLFKVFGRFGELLLGQPEPTWLVQTLGWTYHFLNGASLGIMLVAMVPGRRHIVGAGILWGLTVEALLLASPYAAFFQLPFNQRFIVLTLSAHLVFGLTLGLWLRRGRDPV